MLHSHPYNRYFLTSEHLVSWPKLFPYVSISWFCQKIFRILRSFKCCQVPRTFLEILRGWKETVIWIYNWIKHQKQFPGTQQKHLRTEGSLLADQKDSHKSEWRTACRNHRIVLLYWKTWKLKLFLPVSSILTKWGRKLWGFLRAKLREDDASCQEVRASWLVESFKNI